MCTGSAAGSPTFAFGGGYEEKEVRSEIVILNCRGCSAVMRGSLFYYHCVVKNMDYIVLFDSFLYICIIFVQYGMKAPSFDVLLTET